MRPGVRYATAAPDGGRATGTLIHLVAPSSAEAASGSTDEKSVATKLASASRAAARFTPIAVDLAELPLPFPGPN